MTVNKKVRDEKLQCVIDSQIIEQASGPSQIIEQAKFTYLPLLEALENQTETF